jgi:HEAT repeat protein
MRVPFALLTTLLLALSGCGSKPPATAHGQPISYWVEKIQDADVKTRLQAVKALGNVGAKDAVVVPALSSAVKDKDAEVRAAAILALLRMGSDARAAIPALLDARQDSSAKVRQSAEKALSKIQAS